jgi:hypothetical protein
VDQQQSRGTDEHWGVVHYGKEPQNLNQTAKSPIRLNKGHPDTVFRVRVSNLNPGTTYYYTVDSMEATGRSDAVKSPVKSFTTAGSDQAMAASPQRPIPQSK